MTIKQISIFVENKMGRLAEITKIIGDAGIDIRALSLADTSDFGILRLIVDRPDSAIEHLRAANLTVSLTDVVAVGIEDTPGSFANVLKLMSEKDINIEYMYAFVSRDGGKAFVIMRVENCEETMRVLRQNSIRVLDATEVYHM